MKKRIVSLLLAALMLCALCIPAMAEGTDVLEEPIPATVELQSEKSEEDEDLPTEEAVVNNTATRFGSLVLRYGSGTAEDPYVITAAYQMNNLAEETNKGTSDFAGVYFKLGMSISLNLSAPIGTEEHPFKGNFDGGGNSIQLIVSKENQDYVGLFGYAVGSHLENMVIQPITKTCKITGNNYVGSVCGYLVNGSINNCTNAGEVIGGGDYVGGICGYCENTTISSCRYKCNVFYDDDPGSVTGSGSIDGKSCYIGGICGYMENGTISDCSMDGSVANDSTVYNDESYTGGICGYLKGDISDCMVSGNVTADKHRAHFYVGGICGFVEGTMYNCAGNSTVFAATRKTNGEYQDSNGTYIGGICGRLYGSADRCRNTGAVFGHSAVGGLIGHLSGTLRNCSNESMVFAEGDLIGGLCGAVEDAVPTYLYLINCMNSGFVDCGYGGGLSGIFLNTIIINCISVGDYSTDYFEGYGCFGCDGGHITFINSFYNSDIEKRGMSRGTDDRFLECGRSEAIMKSDAMLASLNGYVSDHPELELLSWDRNPETGYPCLVFPEAAPTANGAAVSIIEDIPMEADQAPSGEEPDAAAKPEMMTGETPEPEEPAGTDEKEEMAAPAPDGSTLSEGSVWIVCAVGAAAVIAVAALVIGKKKRVRNEE